eukprot:gene2378-3106_t
MEPTSMGYDPLLQSWLNTVPHFLEQHKAPFTELFNKLIPGLEGMVFFVRKQCKEVVGTVDNNLVLSMFAIMDSLLKKYERTEDQEPLTPEEIEGAHVCMLPMWIFSFIWSIGASVNGESRPKVEEQMREIASGNNFLEHLPPTESSMYDFCFDQDELVWKFWLNTVPPSKVNPDMPFAEIIVPTIDTIRYTFLLDILLKKGKHVLGVGETGTGKTLTIMEKVNNGMPEVYIPFVGAMGPPGGGKNPVSNRFLRHFNFLAFADMSDESMHRIFNQILGATLERKFAKEIHEMCNPITVCSKPKMVPDTSAGAKPGAKVPDYWEASTKMLADPTVFLDSLMVYDKENIPPDVIKKIQPYIDREDFTTEAIAKVSKACTSICMWARAMHTYYNVSVGVAPKRAALAEAQGSLEVTMGVLAEAKAKLKGVEDKLAELQSSYEGAMQKKQDLAAQVDRCAAQLDRAGKLIGGLGGEKARWEETVQVLTVDLKNVVGDAVVSAGVIAYSGPFTPTYRQELNVSWMDNMTILKLPHTPNASIIKTLADPNDNKIDPMEWRFLLAGPTDTNMSKPNPASDWMTEKVWVEILNISKLTAFIGFDTHVAQNIEHYKKLFESSDAHRYPIAPPFADKLSLFQKLIIGRAIRPDKTQIKMLIGEYDVVPFLVIRVLCGEVNYGGRVTDDKDRRLMNNLLETFIHADVIGENFKFSPSGDYICPSCETVADFMAQIKELPATPKPEIFGLHENADITCDQTETYGTFATVLSLQPRVSGGGGGLSREDIIEQTASSLKERTPSLFDIDLIHHKYPTRYDESMNTVLAQECIRYNALIGVMQIMLREVLKALKGLVVMSPDLEAVANACFNNQVPDSWAAKAYPSMKPLSSWFTDLLERVRFINEWIDLGPPACFWFSGFFFPQAFITGTMQNFARKNQMPIDTIGWDFHIMDHMDPTSNNVAPQDGCYIFGMFMEGARWDSITHKIGESRPKELYSEFPMIWLDPKQHRKPPTTGIYNCPCYKILSRAGTLSTTGHSTNFVMYMEIPSDHPEGHWIDRGLAMFTQLMF